MNHLKIITKIVDSIETVSSNQRLFFTVYVK